MLKRIKYLNIEYTEKDLDYIAYFCERLECQLGKIVDFFHLQENDISADLTIHPDLNDFRIRFKHFFENGVMPLWVSGLTHFENGKIKIETLTLEEFKKTEFRQNDNLESLIFLVLHEFVHACQRKIRNAPNVMWLVEGMATYMANQFDETSPFIGTLNDMINGGNNVKYSNYYLMFKYVYITYGAEYTLELLRNKEQAYIDTPRLYDETCVFYQKENLKK